VPDDPKPPEGESEGGELDLSTDAVKKRSSDLAASMAAAGFDLGIKTEGGS
jgi:hypothetical protein